MDAVTVHRSGDGLPPRRVFVDGREIKRVLVADIARGVVRQHVGFGRRYRVLSRAIRGRVEVKPL